MLVIKTREKKYLFQKGIAAIEVMVIVVALAIAATVAIPVFLQNYQVNRLNITRTRILQIKRAIIGEPENMIGHTRTSFGFVGDLGVLPLNLNQLLNGAGYPSFQLQTNVWFGYRGPYLKNSASLLDAWGNAISYNDSSVSGVLKELRSMGDPNVNGDELVEYIYENEVFNFVSGNIRNKVLKTIKTDYSGPLDIYYPNGNSIVAREIQIIAGVFDSTNENAKFPIGNRYLSTKDLVYKRLITLNGGGKAIVTFMGEESSTKVKTF
jgi:type II secretory pathway pseudopilin PulG